METDVGDFEEPVEITMSHMGLVTPRCAQILQDQEKRIADVLKDILDAPGSITMRRFRASKCRGMEDRLTDIGAQLQELSDTMQSEYNDMRSIAQEDIDALDDDDEDGEIETVGGLLIEVRFDLIAYATMLILLVLRLADNLREHQKDKRSATYELVNGSLITLGSLITFRNINQFSDDVMGRIHLSNTTRH